MPLPLSGGDWIRAKRLRRVSTVLPTINSVNFGSSNIRNPASTITDNIASARSDYILVSENPGAPYGSFGRQINVISSRCISCTPTPLRKVPRFSSGYQHLRLI